MSRTFDEQLHDELCPTQVQAAYHSNCWHYRHPYTVHARWDEFVQPWREHARAGRAALIRALHDGLCTSRQWKPECQASDHSGDGSRQLADRLLLALAEQDDLT